MSAGQVVSKDRLIDAAWNGSPPASAVTRLHSIVSELRRALPPEVIRTSGTGYLLAAAQDDIDLGEARRLIATARAERDRGDLAGASRSLLAALALWRGRAFDGIACTELETEADRIGQEQVTAQEEYAELELRLGNHLALTGPLSEWVAQHPLREDLRACLMRALARSGRQAEAITAYHDLRQQLADELGVDPTPPLRDLYQAILDGDRDLLAPPSPPLVVATAPKPAQLPGDMGDFTGRAEQVRLLREMLAGPAADRIAVVVSAISGTGGIGKTTLAVHAAHLVAGAFPDGQLYVNLAGLSGDPAAPAEVLARLLRDLGVPAGDVPGDEFERAAKYRSVLADRKILLVLDDARDAAQVRPLLPGSASCAVLVTSRTTLADLAGASQLDLEVMPTAEARELLRRIAGPARVAAEPDAAERILRACAGLPLAIRIVAAKLSTRPGWSIAAIAGRLEAERGRLTELRAGDLAVRASFQLSYDGLAAPAARAFRLLGLTGFPMIQLAAAAALLGGSVPDTERTLDTLTDAHVLEAPEPGVYRLHDLMRLFAAELAAASGTQAGTADAEAIERLLTWYAAALRSAARTLAQGRPLPPDIDSGPDRGEAGVPVFGTHSAALAWCQREYANLVWAIRTAAGRQHHELAVKLACMLWMYASRVAEWDRYTVSQRIGLASAQLLGDERAEAWLLNGLGSAVARAGHYDEGAGYYEQSLAIRHRLGDVSGEAACHNNIGNVRYDQGRFADAVAHYEKALALAEASGNMSYLSGILGNAANAYRDMGAHHEALAAYARAIATNEAVGDRHVVAQARTGMGETLRRLGLLTESVEQHQLGLAIQRELGSGHRELLTALDMLAHAYATLGNPAKARECWAEAAQLADVGADPRAAEFRDRLKD